MTVYNQIIYEFLLTDKGKDSHCISKKQDAAQSVRTLDVVFVRSSMF